MQKEIEVKNLKKSYGKLDAVDDVSFDVYKGEIFGLLGENGAGKTTTLEIIEGLRKPTSGSAKILGFDIRKDMEKIKQKIGVQLQSSAYFNYLTLQEIISLFCSFYGKDVNPKELLDTVDLGFKSKTYVDKLSGGQKQRFSIVASLVNDPDIVFLDEPTTGLDPIARRKLWSLITAIKQKGKTIVLTTHYMEEAELLCDRVAIMEKGRVLAIDETHKLIKSAKYPYIITFITTTAPSNKIIKQILAHGGEIENVFAKQNQFEVKLATKENADIVYDLAKSLNPESVTYGHSTLEDVFVELTGKHMAEE